MLTLTKKGREVLGIDMADSDRYGGPEHRYWVRTIAEHLRTKGYEVTGEVPVGNGKTTDLLAKKGRRRIAVEIETGKSDAAANVRKCLDAGFDRVVVVTTSAEANRKIRADLGDCPGVEIIKAAAVPGKDW